jgi:hypothetical protein
MEYIRDGTNKWYVLHNFVIFKPAVQWGEIVFDYYKRKLGAGIWSFASFVSGYIAIESFKSTLLSITDLLRLRGYLEYGSFE